MFLWKINASIEPRSSFPTPTHNSTFTSSNDIWLEITNPTGLGSFSLSLELKLELEIDKQTA